MDKIYIVTGASGYLGSEVCRQLLKRGDTVRTLSRQKKHRSHIPEGTKVYAGNLLDRKSLDRLFETDGPCEFIVIHCAAKISVRKHDQSGYLINVEGTRNIISACKEHNVTKLVYVGSVDSLYNPGNGATIYEPAEFYLSKPSMDYARGKCDAAALAIKAARDGLNCTVVLPACIIGPGDYNSGLISMMFKMYLKGMPPVSISGGYDFVDVRDVAKGILLAVEKGKSGSSYILSGHYRSVTEIFNIMADGLNRHKTLITLPAKIVYPALPLISGAAALAHKEPPITPNALKLLESRAVFSHRKAEKELGYTIRPIRRTVYDTLAFIKKTNNL
ncbi:MAG: NAD-dependent epimerase/dehydratase family protein [Lachnospiraceae bacterium]|nr:NAD-dependent epimerase/dehydratase family protein [Lachnospiraceae bacterium]